MKWKLCFVVAIILNLMTPCSYAKKNVRVGISHFPPFIVINEDQVSGMAIDMLNAMNRFQENFRFTTIITAPGRRILDFKDRRYDLSLFDNINWGWKELDVDASIVYLTGGEVYIALAKKGRGEAFFSDFSKKTMIGILGYHYGFAGFNSSPKFLKKKFNMQLTTSNLGSIKMVLVGNRGDIAVVTKSFLSQYLLRHPEDRKKLLISEKMDQVYNHTIIVRRWIRPTVDEINQLLIEMDKAGVLKPIWRSYGIVE